MFQPQMDWGCFRNASNLDLVEPNRIRDYIYTCNCCPLTYWPWKFYTVHTCTYHLTT